MKKTLILIATLVIITGCDTFYSPVVINGEKAERILVITYTFNNEDKVQTVKFKSEMVFLRRRDGLEVKSIIVKAVDGTTITEYNEAYIAEKKAENASGYRVWVIYDDRLALKSKEFLRKFQRK